MIKLLNLRAGFATNSSSSHSVLLMWGHGASDRGPDWGFHWDHFTLASERMKQSYLASQLAYAVGWRDWVSEDDDEALEKNAQALQIVHELVGEAEVTGVDHQSQWSFPSRWDGVTLHEEFVRELKDFLDGEDVVILGGNDNVEPGEGHELALAHPDKLWKHPLTRGFSVARKDVDHWTLFNRATGMKMRLAFGDYEPRFASAPELVDVKITDHCPLGCAWCYMDSTVAGQHAPFEDVERIAEELAQAEVFEVALGGGEPTMHPDFVQIVSAFRSRGVVPNFTTRSLAWLKDEETVRALRNKVGAFAFSIQKASEVDKLARLVEQSGWCEDGGRAPTIHVVMGTVPKDEFELILDKAREEGFGVTLLGYKRVGRGSEPDHPYWGWWLESAEEHGPWRLGIDTALAAECEDELREAGVEPYMFHTEDGRFSAYIDAVTMEMAPSSWQPERERWAFDEEWREGWLKSAGTPFAGKPQNRVRTSALADSAGAAKSAAVRSPGEDAEAKQGVQGVSGKG